MGEEGPQICADGRVCGLSTNTLWVNVRGLWTGRAQRSGARAGALRLDPTNWTGRVCGLSTNTLWVNVRGLWTGRAQRSGARAGALRLDPTNWTGRGTAPGQSREFFLQSNWAFDFRAMFFCQGEGFGRFWRLGFVD